MNTPLKFGLKQNSSSWETQLLKDGPCNQNNVTWTNVTGTLSIFQGYTYEPTVKVWGIGGVKINLSYRDGRWPFTMEVNPNPAPSVKWSLAEVGKKQFPYDFNVYLKSKIKENRKKAGAELCQVKHSLS